MRRFHLWGLVCLCYERGHEIAVSSAKFRERLLMVIGRSNCASLRVGGVTDGASKSRENRTEARVMYMW